VSSKVPPVNAQQQQDQFKIHFTYFLLLSISAHRTPQAMTALTDALIVLASVRAPKRSAQSLTPMKTGDVPGALRGL
jgi:hypothetical protein